MIAKSGNDEIWKDIDGYEGYYQVSNYGNVRSLTRIVTKCDGSSLLVKGRIMSLGHGKNNLYLCVSLSKNCSHKHVIVHRIVAAAFIGDIPDSFEINHIDGNVQNNHVSNLEIVTHQQNIDHSVLSGLKHDYGEAHVHAKLTNEQANLIRKRCMNGEMQKDLAVEYGVSKQAINNIVHYKSYIK